MPLTILSRLIALALFLVVPCHAQMALTGAGGTKAVSVAAVTFDPAAKGTDIVLSGGNLTATMGSGGSNGYEIVRSTTSHSTGKFYFEITLAAITTQAQFGYGFANATELLNGNFLGKTLNSIGALADGRVFLNNVNTTSVTPASSTNVVSIAIDFGGQLIWWRVNNSSWNNNGSANPATGAGGVSFSTMNAGPYFAAVTASTSTASQAGTINFGGTAYAESVPSGFGNW